MTALKVLIRHYRSYLTVLAIWISGAVLIAASSALQLRLEAMWLAVLWILFSAGIALWILIGLVDRVLGRARANDGVNSAGRGRAFRSALALWAIVTGLFCFGAFFDDGTWFLIALAGIPLLAFWIGVVVWATALAALRLRYGAYGSALRAASVPVLGAVAFFYGQHLGDVARFELEQPSYVAAIATLRAGGSHHDNVATDIGPLMVAFFPWGGMFSTSYGVVFDETDQAAKPVAVRRAAWTGRDVPPELLCEGGVLPVGGHFYIARFAC